MNVQNWLFLITLLACPAALTLCKKPEIRFYSHKSPGGIAPA